MNKVRSKFQICIIFNVQDTWSQVSTPLLERISWTQIVPGFGSPSIASLLCEDSRAIRWGQKPSSRSLNQRLGVGLISAYGWTKTSMPHRHPTVRPWHHFDQVPAKDAATKSSHPKQQSDRRVDEKELSYTLRWVKAQVMQVAFS